MEESENKIFLIDHDNHSKLLNPNFESVQNNEMLSRISLETNMINTKQCFKKHSVNKVKDITEYNSVKSNSKLNNFNLPQWQGNILFSDKSNLKVDIVYHNNVNKCGDCDKLIEKIHSTKELSSDKSINAIDNNLSSHKTKMRCFLSARRKKNSKNEKRGKQIIDSGHELLDEKKNIAIMIDKNEVDNCDLREENVSRDINTEILIPGDDEAYRTENLDLLDGIQLKKPEELGSDDGENYVDALDVWDELTSKVTYPALSEPYKIEWPEEIDVSEDIVTEIKIKDLVQDHEETLYVLDVETLKETEESILDIDEERFDGIILKETGSKDIILDNDKVVDTERIAIYDDIRLEKTGTDECILNNDVSDIERIDTYGDIRLEETGTDEFILFNEEVDDTEAFGTLVGVPLNEINEKESILDNKVSDGTERLNVCDDTTPERNGKYTLNVLDDKTLKETEREIHVLNDNQMLDTEHIILNEEHIILNECELSDTENPKRGNHEAKDTIVARLELNNLESYNPEISLPIQNNYDMENIWICDFCKTQNIDSIDTCSKCLKVKLTIEEIIIRIIFEADNFYEALPLDLKFLYRIKADLLFKLIKTPNFGPYLIDMFLNEKIEIDHIKQALTECITLESAICFLKRQCSLCLDYFPIQKMQQMFSCSCEFCNDCLKTWLKEIVMNKSSDHWFCPSCPNDGLKILDKNLHFLSFQSILNSDEKLKNLFDEKLRDETLQKSSKFQWCKNDQCFFGFEIVDISNPKVKCPDCKCFICINCDIKWHVNETCEQYQMKLLREDPKLSAVFQNNGIECPNCRMKYDLIKGGCLHIQCTKCQFEFCQCCRNEFYRMNCGQLGCQQSGFHAHHPKNCAYYLRDQSIQKLESMLKKTDFQRPFEPNMKQCPTMISGNNLKEKKCRELCYKNFGLCRIHYKEHLVMFIYNNRITSQG